MKKTHKEEKVGDLDTQDKDALKKYLPSIVNYLDFDNSKCFLGLITFRLF